MRALVTRYGRYEVKMEREGGVPRRLRIVYCGVGASQGHDAGEGTRTRADVKKLTPRQQETYNVLKEFIHRNGYPPSRTEIGKALRNKSESPVHHSTVETHLMALMKKGWIEVQPDTPRAIRLLWENIPVVSLGTIAWDKAMLDESRIERRLPRDFTHEYPRTPDAFVIAEDDALSRIGIRKGHYVGIDTTSAAKYGEVVVARLRNRLLMRCLECTDEGELELRAESEDAKHETIKIGKAERRFRFEGTKIEFAPGITFV